MQCKLIDCKPKQQKYPLLLSIINKWIIDNVLQHKINNNINFHMRYNMRSKKKTKQYKIK